MSEQGLRKSTNIDPEQLKLITETAAAAAVRAAITTVSEIQKPAPARKKPKVAGLPIGFSNVDTSREATEKFNKPNHGNPLRIKTVGRLATRQELIDKEIDNLAIPEHTQGAASKTASIFPGLQEKVVDARIKRTKKSIQKQAENKLVLENADNAIRKRQTYTGIAFQGFDIPLRPASRSQRKKSRKLNDAIEQRRSDQMRQKHYTDSYGEEILQSGFASGLRPDNATSATERYDAWKANKAAIQIHDRVESANSRRESILNQPQEKLTKAARKLGRLATQREAIIEAQENKEATKILKREGRQRANQQRKERFQEWRNTQKGKVTRSIRKRLNHPSEQNTTDMEQVITPAEVSPAPQLTEETIIPHVQEAPVEPETIDVAEKERQDEVEFFVPLGARKFYKAARELMLYDFQDAAGPDYRLGADPALDTELADQAHGAAMHAATHIEGVDPGIRDRIQNYADFLDSQTAPDETPEETPKRRRKYSRPKNNDDAEDPDNPRIH